MSIYNKKDAFLIVLDTRNATKYNNGNKLSNLDFEIAYPIRIPTDCIYMSWVVYSFTCHVSWYVINNTNNILNVVVNGVTNSYFFEYGNYNVNTFLTLFKSTLPPTFDITFNQINNKYTITNSSSEFILLANSTIYNIIGLDKSVTEYSSSRTFTMPYPVNFGGINSFNIKCNTIRTDNLDSYENCSPSSIVACVPVYSANNGVIFYEKKNDFEFTVKETIIDKINISIEDDLRNELDFNNQPWNLCIQVNYAREINVDLKDDFHNVLGNY